MRALTVIVALVGVVAADISLTGYQYRVPHTSYGEPSYQYAGGNSGYSVGSAQKNYQNYQSYPGPSYVGYQSGGFGSNNGYKYTGNYQSSGAQVQSPSYQYQTQNRYQSSNQYQSAVAQEYQEYYKQVQNQQQQPAQVFKHFYVHAAPEEPEVPKFRQPPVLPPPQKHYKIIFIKTPSQSAAAPQIVPLPQQNEEKTIVYVLVKKPEEAGDIIVPKVEQKQPSKPEVYFIKYNNKDDSQAVINNIVSDYNKGHSASYSGGSDSSGAYSGHSTEGTLGSQTYGGQNFEAGISGGSQSLSVANVGESSTGSYAIGQSGESGSHAVGLSSVESSGTGHGGFSTGESQSSQNFNSIATSQGVPHETYGTPKFRLN